MLAFSQSPCLSLSLPLSLFCHIGKYFLLVSFPVMVWVLGIYSSEQLQTLISCCGAYILEVVQEEIDNSQAHT